MDLAPVLDRAERAARDVAAAASAVPEVGPGPTEEEWIEAEERFAAARATYLELQTRLRWMETLTSSDPFASVTPAEDERLRAQLATLQAGIDAERKTVDELRDEILREATLLVHDRAAAVEAGAQVLQATERLRRDLAEGRGDLASLSAAATVASLTGVRTGLEADDRLRTTLASLEEAHAVKQRQRELIASLRAELAAAETEASTADCVAATLATEEESTQRRLAELSSAATERSSGTLSAQQQVANMIAWYHSMIGLTERVSGVRVVAHQTRQLVLELSSAGVAGRSDAPVLLTIHLAPPSTAERVLFEAQRSRLTGAGSSSPASTSASSSSSSSEATGSSVSRALIGVPISAEVSPAVVVVDDLVDRAIEIVARQTSSVAPEPGDEGVDAEDVQAVVREATGRGVPVQDDGDAVEERDGEKEKETGERDDDDESKEETDTRGRGRGRGSEREVRRGAGASSGGGRERHPPAHSRSHSRTRAYGSGSKPRPETWSSRLPPLAGAAVVEVLVRLLRERLA